jgi:hypothetical protein
MKQTLNLKVDGQEISLNPFVESIISNVIYGIINSLDKIPMGKERIEIVIDKKK